MKQRTLAFGLIGATLLLGGCEGVDFLSGGGKDAPDEFAVFQRAPLAIPPDYGLRARAPALCVGGLETFAQVVDELGGLRPCGLRLFFRRHFAEVELIEDALPDFESTVVAEVRAEGVEADVVLLLLGSMALVAVLLEEGLELAEFGIVPGR